MRIRIIGAVAAAGVGGAALRWTATIRLSDDWALLVVNVAGCAIVGWATARHDAARRLRGPRRIRRHRGQHTDAESPWLTVGFCGALTSMSALALQLAQRLNTGEVGAAGAWLGLTIAACTAAFIGGRAAVGSRRGSP